MTKGAIDVVDSPLSNRNIATSITAAAITSNVVTAAQSSSYSLCRDVLSDDSSRDIRSLRQSYNNSIAWNLAKPMCFSKFLVDCEDASGGKCEDGIKIVLNHVALSAKIIANIVQRASLVGFHGDETTKNSSGDQQKTLDVLANEVFIDTMRDSGKISLMVSEENSEAIIVRHGNDTSKERGNYAIVFDPLDGSSNIDCQVAIGTIFGIYKVKNTQDPCVERDILGCSGRNMISAGYILYSSSVQFVLSTGADVNVFTLDPNFGEFVLTKKKLRIPDSPKTIYSVNEGRENHWNQTVKEFVTWCKGKNYTHRYIGSMVADVHRTLIYGGIFFYPAEKN